LIKWNLSSLVRLLPKGIQKARENMERLGSLCWICL
jgi:hypothetical protein